jgi:CRISPR-associated protein Cas5d
MTPSAADGLLSSIFWKPEFRWVVQWIEVLAPVKWASMRRNEVAIPITYEAVRLGVLDANKATQQRMTLMLRDVHYRVAAQIWVHPSAEEQNAAKWRDQFRRRLAQGRTFRTPFLGMREFHADVEPVDATKPVAWEEDLGIMTHSIRLDSRGQEVYEWFAARVEHGRMNVPPHGLTIEGGLQ